MANKMNILGKRFGRLLVTEESPSRKNRHGSDSMWLCKCDCGNVKIIMGRSLKWGRTKSCGCLQKELFKARLSLPESQAAFNKLFYRYKKQAKDRNILFKLSVDYFKILTKGKCYYCNSNPSYSVKRCEPKLNGDYIYNGIDRINSNKGYIKENVVSCCAVCNKMKNNMSESDFLDCILNIYEHRIGD